MSSILKALKKLEEEKVLHEESAGIKISREILKQKSDSRNKNRWLWLLGSSAAVVIITQSAALLRTSIPKEAVNPPELPTYTRQPALPALPVEKLPVKPQSTGSSKAVSPPSLLSNEPNLKPARQRFDQPAAPSRQRETVQPPTQPPTTTAPPNTDPVVNAAPLRQPAGREQTLTLSGIAWNKDSADRLAIINGQPTATGATVNGILVEEILQDRVRLSNNGKFFELLIGKDATID